MEHLSRRAYAKLNLGLEVLARRDDGYHELVTVFQTVSLADEVTASPAAGLTIRCKNPLSQAAATWSGRRLSCCKRAPVRSRAQPSAS